MAFPYILHISSIKTWGGGEQQLIYLYQVLHKHQIPQFILCKKNSALELYCKNNSISHLTFDSLNSWMLKKICATHLVNIIHLHDARSHGVALLTKLLFRIKPHLIVSRKVNFPIDKHWTSRYKYNSTQVEKIICISEAIYNNLSKSVVDRTKLSIIHDSIDLTRFNNLPGINLRKLLNIDSKYSLVGTACNLVPTKDIFTFLNVAEQVIHSGNLVKFLIMGDGPLKESLQNYAIQLNIAEHVFFLGFREDIPDLLPQLNAFMLTSTDEGLGSILLEAMACHVAIVATRVGGIPECVIDEQTGLLAEAGDVSGLSEALKRILTDLELKQRLINQATKHLSNFSIESMGEKTLAIYKGVL